MTDTIDEIRARHEVAESDGRYDLSWHEDYGLTAHYDRATLLRALDAMAEESARLKEAFFGPAAWLDRWAQHVGNCKGGDVCTCGLTFVRTEARAALKEPGQ
jgi:hypothetical protein